MEILGAAKFKHEKNRNSLPDLLQLIEFGVTDQKNEFHKIFDYFLQAVAPFKTLFVPEGR